MEAPSNPLLTITDIARISTIAHDAAARCACDNTWATPLLQQPLQIGADLVVHATQPHVVHDYVLYGLCDLRGIPSVMFERSSLPGRIFPMSRLEDGNLALIGDYERARADRPDARVDLPQDIEDYLAAMQGNYADVMPARLKYKLDRAVDKVTPGQEMTPASRIMTALSALARAGRSAVSVLASEATGG